MINCVILFPSLVLAAPVVNNVFGTISHGQSITISGSSFGTKSPAAPLFWDNGEGAHALSSKYSGYGPTNSDGYNGDNNFNLAYHSGNFRSMSNPHTHGTRYISGGHDPDGADTHGYDDSRGANVGMVVQYNVQPFQKVYLTYYHALDPLWSGEGVHVNLDGGNYNMNHKEINYQAHDALGLYDGTTNYYGSMSASPWSGAEDIAFFHNDTDSGNRTDCLDGTQYCLKRSGIVGNWLRVEDIVDFSGQVNTTRFNQNPRQSGLVEC